MDLFLEQKQHQKLSPQMIQSMEILQMGTLELHEYVEEQLLENPMLEREENYTQEEGSLLLHKLEWLAANSQRSRSAYAEESRCLADAMADPAEESLYDHLGAQIPWKHLSPVMRRGVECVLTGLNDNGWLDESTEELAARGGVSCDVIVGAELIVQNMEPAGVGARTLAQCLELQLDRIGETGLARRIAQNHLEDLAKDHYNQIARVTGASQEDVRQACRQIRALDPRPGAAFAHKRLPAYITPDILVAEEDGQLTVHIVGQNLPELKISAYYRDLIHSSEEDQVRTYLAQKLQQANWVIKHIEQRRNTMLQCARCIVMLQEKFFRQGRHFLRPLSLADVAAETGVHESTVSRAIRNKYVQCTWGLFPLSEFFSRALSSGNKEFSAAQVKKYIRTLIEQEDKHKPLSDQKICDALAEQSTTVSRRTVAKYRDEMGFPSAPGRKEF